MIVIADAGPTVYTEAVTQGKALGAPDADRLEAVFAQGQIRVQSPVTTTLPVPAELGQGETESILLAIELQADWLLADNQAARQTAQRNIAAVGGKTAVRGTLGILAASVQENLLKAEQAITIMETLKQRPDV